MLHYQHEEEEMHDEIHLVGSLEKGHLLKLEYKAKNPEVTQFGFLILDLSANGQKLSGRFLSYSKQLEHLTYGNVELRKIPS